MLGYLLARAGIDVTVLEKWQDFFRDFRGDTIHPSTMQCLDKLGLLDEFLKLPHSKAPTLKGVIGGEEVLMADFRHMNIKTPYIAFIPQWDFLNFLSAHAAQYPNFHLLMETEATDLIKEKSSVRDARNESDSHNQTPQIVGVTAVHKGERLEIEADLVIGADGRHSTIRQKSGLMAKNLGAPMDVLWFRLSRKQSDPLQSLGQVDYGKVIIMINRDSYWQCGFVIPKGNFEAIKADGIENFQDSIEKLVPFLSDRVSEILGWGAIRLLTVTVDHLEQWYRPGLLCIGDAAHAMSPIGGVGINLAIQDAVATANILGPKLLNKNLTTGDLAAVQRRRKSPALWTQRLQIFIQNHGVSAALNDKTHMQMPLLLRIVKKLPLLARIPARIIGIGFRPEQPNHFFK